MFLYLLFITIIVCMCVQMCMPVYARVCVCVCFVHTMPQQVLHSSEENPQTLLLSVTVGSGD